MIKKKRNTFDKEKTMTKKNDNKLYVNYNTIEYKINKSYTSTVSSIKLSLYYYRETMYSMNHSFLSNNFF